MAPGDRVSRWAPGLAVLRGYRRSWLSGDLLAGVAVAAYLVPQVMAYAEIAGLPAASGLAAACGSLVVYAILGSSRQLSVGPESTTALMTAVAVAPLAAGDPARYGALAAGLAVVVGVICLLGRLARAGALADLLSRPVLVGYLAGVAVIMIVSQLGKVTGISVDGRSVAAELASFARGLDTVHGPTAVLAAALLVFLFVGARLAPRWPVPLVGMLLAAGAVAVFSLQDQGIAVVGSASTGLQAPAVPALGLDDWGALLLPAVGIAVVGYSDNMLTSRSFAARKGQNVDGNAELVALGAANVVSSFLRGFPVSSSGSRTAIGDAQGSRTQLHSLVAVVLVLAVLLFGQAVLASFPVAALGAVVVYAATRLVDVAEFRRIARFRRTELLLALVTTAAVLVFGVLYGVLAAVAASVVELLRRLARPHDAVLGFVPGVAGMHDLDDYPDARPVPGLVVYRYDAPLCFANAEDFRRSALGALDSNGPDPPRWFLLNAEANVELDSTAAAAMDALISELRRRGIEFALARVKQDLRDVLRTAGLLDRIGPDRVFMTLPTAIAAFHAWDATHAPGPDAGPPPTDSGPSAAGPLERDDRPR